MPMRRIGTPIGAPEPTARVPVVVMRTLEVPLADAPWDKVIVPPETEDTVVPDAMSGPVMASPLATVEGNVPETVAVVEPLVVVTPWTSRSGPRLVSWPQSVICDEPVAHHSR